MRGSVLVSVLAACDGLMHGMMPRACVLRAGNPAAMVSRRAVSFGAAAAIVLPALPAHASDDALADRLMQARTALDSAKGWLANDEIQSVRKTVDITLKLLTIKGYLGESVKSRAADMGEGDASAVILAERKKLILNLGYLDKYCYSRQTGADASGASDAERNREEALTALDAILARL